MTQVTLPQRLLSRILPHALVWFFVWPALATVSAVFAIRQQSLFHTAPKSILLAGSAIGTLHLIPELLAVALLGTMLTVTLFALAFPRRLERSRIMALPEPMVAIAALVAGAALNYPAVLTHPALKPLHSLQVLPANVALVSFVLVAAVLWGNAVGNWRGATGGVGAAIILLAGAAGLSALPPPALEAQNRGIILLGLDSISISDRMESLQSYAEQEGGEWYGGAVAPGLLTNSTWTAILKGRPVADTGIFLVYQTADWTGEERGILGEAERRGYRTISWVTSQFTMPIGSDAGFDVNRSGPKGWLQITTAAVKNTSVLLPIVLRPLPRLPFTRTPPNQSGTFAYDLDRDLREVLAGGGEEGPVFVVAHLDYLHATAFPAMTSLSASERSKVRKARVDSIIDQSLDWQSPEVPGDPIELQRWKIRNLERAVVEALSSTRVLAPEKQNRVVILGDHGDRSGISRSNFINPRYFNVIFTTFGIPERSRDRPISLLEIGSMVGLAPPREHRAVVAYAHVDEQRWTALESTARPRFDGSVELDAGVVAALARELACFEPGSGAPIWNCPAAPD